MNDEIPRTLNGLPEELKLNVLKHCGTSQLKALKQQNKVWKRLSTAFLFRQIYVAPLPRTLAYFNTVTQTPLIAQHIQHLIFHDSQLDKALLNRAAYLAALPSIYPEAQKIAAWKTYCKLYFEQQFLLTIEDDYATLMRGLPCLPNLKKVTIIGGPSRHPGNAWYFTRGPHALDFRGTGLTCSFWSSPSDLSRHAWDGRAVHNLFRALSVTRIRLTEMHIGNWYEPPNAAALKMGIPLSTLNPSDTTTAALLASHGARIFKFLTKLNLQVDMERRFLGHEYDAESVRLLFKLLSNSYQLETLKLGFTGVQLPVYLTNQLLTCFHWSALQTVRFREMVLAPGDLNEFLERHTGVSEFRLERVGFDVAGGFSWEKVVEQCKRLKEMERVDLNVYEWVLGPRGDIRRVVRRWKREGGVGTWV